jgi:hypothetical protein
MRFIRLILGGMIIVQGFQTHQWAMLGVGVLFTLMPLLNIGYCSNNSCKTRSTFKQNHKQTEEIQYEEVS